MSDYLTRVAGLTRGETAPVKPRLPGHFAPLPDTGAEAASPDAAAALRASRQGMEPRNGQRQARPGPDAATPGAFVRERQIETGDLRPVSTGPVSQAPGAAQVETRDRNKPGQTSASLPLAPETPEEPANRPTLAGTDRADFVSGFTGHTELQTHPIDYGGEGVPPSRRENEVAAPTPASPVQPKLLVQTQPSGHLETRSADLPAVVEQPQRARSEPAIHINIGRIEVRASTPAPRAQAPVTRSAPASKLSLQDYLKRAGTGGKQP